MHRFVSDRQSKDSATDCSGNTRRYYIKHMLILMVLVFSSEPVLAGGQSAEVSGVLEEVVVTARKREESLQDTPISISAFTRQDLDARQVDNVYQLAESTPNMVFDQGVSISGSSASSSVSIRGVGQLDFTFNTDPGVGIYVDGVYLSRSIGGLVDLLDVERVEVLRGPQGTLFGKNTIGGAINITTIKPHGTFEGKAGVSVGNFKRLDGYFSVNVPVNEELASSFSMAYRTRDGYIDRLQDGDEMGDVDSLSGRGAINWRPTDDLEVDIRLDGTRKREGALPVVNLAIDGRGSFGGFHNAVVAPMLDPSVAMGKCFIPTFPNPVCYNKQWEAGPFSTNNGIESLSELDLWGLSATVAYDIGEVTFKSISAIRDFTSRSSLDLDGSPLHVFEFYQNQELQAVSQEFQLLGNAFDEKLDWIVGFYYLTEEGDQYDPIDASLIDFTSGGYTENESIAAFMQGTYQLTDKLSLTAGIRYTDDTREFTPDSSIIQSLVPALPPGTRFLPQEEFTTTADDWTPMVTLSYFVTDQLNTYFTYSEGFKSGGFSQRINTPLPEPPSFQPEYVSVYEGGMKFTGLDNRLRANLAVFSSDYTDIQVLGTPPNVIGTATVNAGEADINGVELELSFLPLPGLLLQAGAGYIDAEYTELLPIVQNIQITNALPNTPEWTINASASYEIGISGGHTLTPRIDWFHRSEVFNDAANTPLLRQGSYELINASLAFESADSMWALVLSGKNLTDETYLISGNVTAGISSTYGNYALPRSWMMNVERRF